MKNPITVAIVLSFLASVSAFASDPYRIVLTSFDPFGLSSKNNSQPIAKRVAQLTALIGENVQIDVCNLPVVYDQASHVAEDCISKSKPDAVISLGEGHCDLRIETAASNWDSDSLPDNAGVVREGILISQNGPRRSAFNFPVQAMFCAVYSAYPAPVEVSADPGYFVCNNTAYHLSQDLSARGTPFTFIHVPHSRCSASDRDVEKNAQLIAKMLHGAISELKAPTRTAILKMPSNKAEAQTVLMELNSSSAPACERDFAERLVAASRE